MRSDQRPRRRSTGERHFQPQHRAPQRTQSFDSNGPNLKIRGGAYQIFERYVTLAREAAIGGDPVTAENLYQHAEHYFRIDNANREGSQQGPPPTTPADVEMNPSGAGSGEAEGERSQPRWVGDATGFVEPSAP